MKKYTEPSVQVVSLKSSEDIATTYKQIAEQIVNGYIDANSKRYQVSQYTLSNSTITE